MNFNALAVRAVSVPLFLIAPVAGPAAAQVFSAGMIGRYNAAYRVVPPQARLGDAPLYAESIRRKARWAMDKNLRGVFVWQVLADHLLHLDVEQLAFPAESENRTDESIDPVCSGMARALLLRGAWLRMLVSSHVRSAFPTRVRSRRRWSASRQRRYCL